MKKVKQKVVLRAKDKYFIFILVHTHFKEVLLYANLCVFVQCLNALKKCELHFDQLEFIL